MSRLLLTALLVLGPPGQAGVEPLAPEAARAYAGKVMEAVQLVRENHVLAPSSAQFVAWSIEELFAHLDETIPSDLAARMKKLPKMSTAEQEKLLADARQTLGSRDGFAKDKDVHVTLKRMLPRLDLRSGFIAPGERDIVCRIGGDHSAGIGARLRKHPTTGHLEIVTPLVDGPAHRAGLLPGDQITKVIRRIVHSAKEAERHEIELKGQKIDEALWSLNGAPGTRVTLGLLRDGMAKEVTLTRARCAIETVLGLCREAKSNAWNHWADEKSRIAYVRLTNLRLRDARHVRQVLATLSKQPGGLNGLILDLRFHPGGLLSEAVQVADLFIGDGRIVTIRSQRDAESHDGKLAGSLLDFPIVCLVNGDTRSSGEIVAAALQDHKRARIIGERTAGKGSIQRIQPWEGGLLVFTLASFRRPSGKELNRFATGDEWGVLPDTTVALTDVQHLALLRSLEQTEWVLPAGMPRPRATFDDPQLAAARDQLRRQIQPARRSRQDCDHSTEGCP